MLCMEDTDLKIQRKTQLQRYQEYQAYLEKQEAKVEQVGKMRDKTIRKMPSDYPSLNHCNWASASLGESGILESWKCLFHLRNGAKANIQSWDY